MKGSLYVAILLTALLCDATVSDDLSNNDELGSHYDAKGDEISDGEELSDSEVNDESNSFVIDKENAQDHILLADNFLKAVQNEINKKSNYEEVEKEFHEPFGEYVTEESDYYDETLFSAEDLNYKYSDDRHSNFIEARKVKQKKHDHGISNKAETRRPEQYSHEAGAEIFSSEEENGWDTDKENHWLGNQERDQGLETDKGRVSKEKRSQAGEDQKGRATEKEKRRVNDAEPKSGSKKQNPIGNELHASDHKVEQIRNPLNSTTFITVNHYFCMSEEVTEKHLILYGTQAWEFPLQDVNLTLTYPTSKPDSTTSADSVEEVEYIITGFKVILYIEGTQTKGYITDGGILQDKLSLTFINSDATSLFYKFWLYGTPKTNAQLIELHHLYFMCS